MVSPSVPRHAIVPPLRLAIIGSGPSGFYSAARVLSSLKARQDVLVHMYERLPVPNGLVRWGVAPDHLEVKNVENRFAEVASDPRFSFFGNVNVTAPHSPTSTASSSSTPATGYQYPHALHIPLSDLAQNYTHLLLSYGCSHSRMLGIPGSAPGEVLNVHSALDFVNWYNGHPAAHDEEILAKEPWRRVALSESMRDMSIIGAGNVALDVARIVLRASHPSTPAARDELAHSDVPESVLSYLSSSRISHVDINARRGPAQAAFTNKELREMLALPGVGFEGVDPQLIAQAEKGVAEQEEEQRQKVKGEELSEADKEEAAHAAGQARVKKRLLSLLAKGSKTKPGEADKRWGVNFFRAPAAFLGSEAGTPRLEKIQWTATALGLSGAATAAQATGGPSGAVWGNEPTSAPQEGGSHQGAATLPSGSTSPTRSLPSSTFETRADLVVSSVGYKGAPLGAAMESPSPSSTTTSSSALTIPWDPSRGIVPNNAGRVTGLNGKVYVSGWLARGPVGVIASTMHDAYSVADAILEDHSSATSAAGLTGSLSESQVPETIRTARTREGKQIVDWTAWQRLDVEERRRGKEAGKEREKVLQVEEMLRIMDS
ncbi:nucleotide-binding domain-containing protein [Jaminaea rosea]|uniref:Nucleotide-binding domain-containing protein n=1 Tax=Jaminaea rosea TaxID=1569628 RepID=A0A316V3F2_9BASI|nr:nucleotide-binding domain-containing protein [Jaminaea rosea]PWN31061.1 nucleotide-binding domain-containing protein [Jaminaea rosea]